MIQKELLLRLKRQDKVNELSLKMLNILEERKTWVNRREMAHLGMSARECRLAREHSSARIIMGQAGYKAISCATMKEVYACAHTLQSQSKRMAEEAQQYWKAYHNCMAMHREAK